MMENEEGSWKACGEVDHPGSGVMGLFTKRHVFVVQRKGGCFNFVFVLLSAPDRVL